MVKDDRSPVTVADFASQAVVAHGLAEALGTPVLVAEEDADDLFRRASAAQRAEVLAAVRLAWPEADEAAVVAAIRMGAAEPAATGFWTLDPIDGTKGFLRGRQYAIALAWVEAGVPVLGVLGCPNLAADPAGHLEDVDPSGSLYWAVRGAGAWRVDGEDPLGPCSEVACEEPAPTGPVLVCESVEAAHSDHDRSARLLARLGVESAPLRVDSQCKYALVAAGRAHAYLRLPTRPGYVERIWDHAAGEVVATEAGCRVTDVDGRALDFSRGRGLAANRGVVCAPPGLAERLVAAVGDV